MRVLSKVVYSLIFLAVVSNAYTRGDEQRDRGLKNIDILKKQTLIKRLDQELRSKYVFPEIGEKMGAFIHGKMENGDYNKFELSEKLASQIEKDLFAIAMDKHLHLVFLDPETEKKAKESLPDRTRIVNDNFGFKRSEILPGNIGYIKIDRMAIEREAAKVAAEYIKRIVETRAIIIDLRDNQGGAAGMVVFLAGYLFDHPKHLYSMYNRLRDQSKDVWTFSGLPGKKPGKDKQVYILTSSKTFSAAEGFAYSLKHHNRAIIVGERTGGGAHPMIWIKLPYNFKLCLPYARIIHPVTHTDWEGTGVIPHFEVRSDKALETAINLINKDKK